ncbi:hypothetical protein ACOSQ4_006571 [Xanthoceras sorbifolium]
MAASAKRPRTEDPSTVNISVKNQALHRTIKRLLSNYWKKKILEYETIHFLIEGNCFSHPLTCCLRSTNGGGVSLLINDKVDFTCSWPNPKGCECN